MIARRDVSALIERWLAEDLDAWTRRVLRRHFAPATGSPYWLKRAAELPFDPLEIESYDDLVAFGPFALDQLRSLDPADLVPAAVSRPLAGQIWDTGGTTGSPCRVFYTPAMLDHRRTWRTWSLSREGFDLDRVWVQATPTGPHLMGRGGLDVAEAYGGRVYGIDFDPRWVKRMLRDGRLKDAQEYTDHVIDQAAAVMRAQPVDYLSTTPMLFQAMIRRVPDLVAGLRGVRMAGTHATPAMWRSFRAAIGDGLISIFYGNTFGNTASLPVEQDGDLMPCVPNFPQISMAVVDPREWTRQVGYGQSGQVRLTVMHDDLFLPNILERDLAERYDTGPAWPCDGVANVRPLQVLRESPEGIY
jgi:hypothetical protein